MTIDKCILRLVEKNILQPVPVGVNIFNYDLMIETANQFNWIYPTIEQIEAAAQELSLEVNFENRKIGLIETENQNYLNLLSLGYTNSNFNITLAIEETDRTAFANMLTMINLAIDLNQTLNDFTIADINGNLHDFSLQNLKILLLSYGFYYQTIWQQHKAKIKQIELANTIEELNEI